MKVAHQKDSQRPINEAPKKISDAIRLWGPFPPGIDPCGVQGERYHIEGRYADYLKQKYEDGFSAMINLWQCIQHHPGLKADAEALQAVVRGSSALIAIGNQCSAHPKSDRKLTAVESWLRNRFNHRDLTAGWILSELHGVPEMLMENPATVELAEAIKAMLEGHYTMMKIRRWLDTL